MRLLNKTKHSTAGLRIMLYDLAQKANISTRGVTVEVRRASQNLHGCCYPNPKKVILWLLNSSKTQDIGFIWLHELAHLTPRNRRLYAAGHGIRGQIQADNVATKVLGVTKEDLNWHKKDWRNYGSLYRTKTEALEEPNNRECYPDWRWRLVKVGFRIKKGWRWQWKHK